MKKSLWKAATTPRSSWPADLPLIIVNAAKPRVTLTSPSRESCTTRGRRHTPPMDATFERWFPAPAVQIAMFHTFFNVVCTILFLPFSEGFVKLSQALVKEKKEKADFTYLDERMLVTPAIAVTQRSEERRVGKECRL